MCESESGESGVRTRREDVGILSDGYARAVRDSPEGTNYIVQQSRYGSRYRTVASHSYVRVLSSELVESNR